jgi:spermidine synthase
LALLLSAFLLFCVQPMIAKMILPLLGGSPSVWNTCMVFFQAELLAGYYYVHLITSLTGFRRQAVVHAGLLLLPILVLPFSITPQEARSLSPDANPTGWLLGLLLVTVGGPFFVLSASAPLLKRWFSLTSHPAAKDPYFLYGSSNFGSMLGLLGYPLFIEPRFRLVHQSRGWAVGYGCLVVLVWACAAMAWRFGAAAASGAVDGSIDTGPERLGIRRRLWWIALAFVPSSLMLGVTTYIATDLASVPLLWVIPLALYLLSFILVSARRPVIPHAWMCRLLPLLVALSLTVILFEATHPFWVIIPIHLVMFFVAAMVCHGELLIDRPMVGKLTSFYLCMSVGGVLGGLFNALVAPVVFDRVVEYPLAIVLAALCRPVPRTAVETPRERQLDLLLPLGIGALTVGLILGVQALHPEMDRMGLTLMFGAPMLLWYHTLHRPLRFGLGVGAIMLASGLSPSVHGHVLHRERDFFGVVRVTRSPDAAYNLLLHGSTIHGLQSREPSRRREPLTYYHRTGPAGQIFQAVPRRNVAVVGLGAGSLTSYAGPGQRWTYYEIGPAIERIARDPRYFTYLRDCRASTLEVVLGDARLQLRTAPEVGYGLIVLDAFSSDAIPMHLLTREALGLYRRKLTPDGAIAFHISNRFLDLAPVLGALARDSGLVSRVRYDINPSVAEQQMGKSPSIWLVMAHRDADLGPLATDPVWVAPRVRPDEPVWTDDFSNIIEHFVIRL